jgi:hypothetical protein
MGEKEKNKTKSRFSKVLIYPQDPARTTIKQTLQIRVTDQLGELGDCSAVSKADESAA